MDIVLTPTPLKGEIAAIPSKSVAHRMLICAAFADAPTTLYIPQTSDDINATADCMKALGASIEISGAEYKVTPITTPAKAPTLDCGESGSTLRFLLPVAAVLGNSSQFIGRGRLPQRPLSDLLDAMKEQGTTASAEMLPLTLQGKLRGGHYRIAGNVSSQYITGLLLALPLTEEDSTIEITTALESASYIDITLSVLKIFGIEVTVTEHTYHIKGGQRYHSPQKLLVEGDWSNAAFFLSAAAIGNDLAMRGLNENSAQGDRKIISLLKTFGAAPILSETTIGIKADALNGCTIDIRDTPDLLPILSVVAAYAKGTTTFINAARLRLKESDRLESTAALIRNLGGKAETTADSITIYGTGLIGGTVNSCNDHRIAMAAAIAATHCKEPVTICGAEAVNKSYPGFFEDYKTLGGKANVIHMG
ncbi:MAG: 3-phosphoshikimate 1-carboxyvinyltransferase [Firmicutes bacterium]|nr:3-phosphoshikimate 1-carboxyvinyltransferase [Bacillota bacterium]